MKILSILFLGLLCICSLCIGFLIWEDSGYIHYGSLRGTLDDGLVEAIDYCSYFELQDVVCTYETKDRYYFYLSSKSFGYNEFEKPSVELKGDNIVLKLVTTKIRSDSKNESYQRFYINKLDFPEAKGVMLDYYLYDKDWKLLEHKEEQLVFPNFDVNLKYRNKVK